MSEEGTDIKTTESNCRICVVDDDADSVEAITVMLRLDGLVSSQRATAIH